jgi:hypothetical protein
MICLEGAENDISQIRAGKTITGSDRVPIFENIDKPTFKK